VEVCFPQITNFCPIIIKLYLLPVGIILGFYCVMIEKVSTMFSRVNNIYSAKLIATVLTLALIARGGLNYQILALVTFLMIINTYMALKPK